MISEHTNGKWIKVTQLVLTAVAVTAIPWCIWATSRIHAMDVAVAKLDTFAAVGGRFTQENGQTLRLELMAHHAAENAKVWQELAAIQSKWLKEISILNTQIATLPQSLTLPPKWWEEYVKTELTRHDQRISVLEALKP
jgi:hypothetical protein